MKVSMSAALEGQMNMLAQSYQGEGLVGFATGDRTENEGYLVRRALKVDIYPLIAGNAPTFREISRLAKDKKEFGRLFPWLINRRESLVRIEEWMEGFGKLGREESLISIPKRCSTELYIPGEGLEGIEILEREPHQSGYSFSKALIDLYFDIIRNMQQAPQKSV